MSRDLSFATGSILARGDSGTLADLALNFGDVTKLKQQPTQLALHSFALAVPEPEPEPEPLDTDLNLKLQSFVLQYLESILNTYIELSSIAPARYVNTGSGFGRFFREIWYG